MLPPRNVRGLPHRLGCHTIRWWGEQQSGEVGGGREHPKPSTRTGPAGSRKRREGHERGTGDTCQSIKWPRREGPVVSIRHVSWAFSRYFLGAPRLPI